jgi:hypothetical protein
MCVGEARRRDKFNLRDSLECLDLGFVCGLMASADDIIHESRQPIVC